MSHFMVIVFTEGMSESEIDKKLAPFEESEGNKNSKWDWYMIGGGWNGCLIHKIAGKCNSALVRDCSIDFFPERYPNSFVTINGKWVQNTLASYKSKFDKAWKEAVENGYYATIVDCHM